MREIVCVGLDWVGLDWVGSVGWIRLSSGRVGWVSAIDEYRQA